GTLINRANFGVPIELLRGVLLRVPVAAKELEGLASDPVGDLGAEELRHRGFLDELRAGILEARRVVHHESGGFELHPHLGQLELHALKIGDRLAELLSFLGIGHRGIERALSNAKHLRADSDSAFVQSLDRDLVPDADRPEHVLGRHPAGLEDELAGARRPDPELVLLLADRKAREIALYEKRGTAL